MRIEVKKSSTSPSGTLVNRLIRRPLHDICVVFSTKMGCTQSSCLNESGYVVKDMKGTLTPVTVVDETVHEVSGKNFESYSARVHTTRAIEEDYEIEKSKVVGSGYSGPVRPGVSKLTHKRVAIKSFNKAMLTPKRLDFLRSEVSVYLLMDHPNIARLLDVYEDDKFVHIVMEFCSGKELYHRLVKRSRYSERDAAHTAYEMLLAVNYLHQHNVVHRDIKLENFLYEDPSDHARLKLIDFGFSKLWYPTSENCRLKASCGSIQYVAPEVLKGRYNEKCDMWSLGVVTFMLLVGEPPFEGFEDDILDNIQKCQYSFNSKRWRTISESAKNFVAQLLVADPEKRMSASDALNHPWIQSLGTDDGVDVPVEILKDIRNFAMGNHLRRAALSMLAYTLTSDEIHDLHSVFLSMDNSKDGTINLNELVDVMKEKLNISESEIEDIFGKLDRSHQGRIEYTNFLAATMASRIRLHEDLIRHLFDQFDADHNGRISLGDLQSVLGPTIDGDDIEIILREADADGDGMIDYEEFEKAFKMTEPINIRTTPSNDDVPPPLIPLDRQRSIKMALAKLRAVSALSRTTSSKRGSVDDSSIMQGSEIAAPVSDKIVAS